MSDPSRSPEEERMRSSMAELYQALAHVQRVRLRRGRGSQMLRPLMGLVSRDREEGLDADAIRSLASVIDSLVYAVEDAEAEAQRNLRTTGRTIAQALRRPF